MTWSVLMLDNQGIFVIFVVLGWSLVIAVVEEFLGPFFSDHTFRDLWFGSSTIIGHVITK